MRGALEAFPGWPVLRGAELPREVFGSRVPPPAAPPPPLLWAGVLFLGCSGCFFFLSAWTLGMSAKRTSKQMVFFICGCRHCNKREAQWQANFGTCLGIASLC